MATSVVAAGILTLLDTKRLPVFLCFTVACVFCAVKKDYSSGYCRRFPWRSLLAEALRLGTVILCKDTPSFLNGKENSKEYFSEKGLLK